MANDAFIQKKVNEYCGVKSIGINMAACEAHWQNGIVERHIGTFRELFNKLLLEDTFAGATIQSVVDQTCEATLGMARILELPRANGSLDALYTHWLLLPKLPRS